MSKVGVSKKLSLSMMCLAGGAVVSGNSVASVIDSNINDDSINYDDNFKSEIAIKPVLGGKKYAKLYNTGYVGTSVEAGKASSGIENCYSNCHAVIATPTCHTESVADQCAELGFAYTTCPTYYKDNATCTVSGGSAYKSCTAMTNAEKCAYDGYATTSCSTGYTLTGQCAYDSSYYQSCQCHADCTNSYSNVMAGYSAFSTAATNIANSTVATCSAMSLSSISGLLTISTQPCVSTTSSLNTALTTAYTSLSAMSSYVTNGCSVPSAFSCYSNSAPACHTDACATYATNIYDKIVAFKSAADAIMATNSFSTCMATYGNITGVFTRSEGLCVGTTSTLNDALSAAYTNMNTAATNYNNAGCTNFTTPYTCYANGVSCHSDTTDCATIKSTLVSIFGEKTAYPYACRRVYYYTDTTGTSALPYCAGTGYTTGSFGNGMTMAEYNAKLSSYNSLCTAATGALSTSTYTLKVVGTSGTGTETCFPQDYVKYNSSTGAVLIQCSNAY